MKILKILLAIIAVLVIGFFAIGMIKPDISYTCEVTVDKPVAEAWGVLHDESKLGEWLIGYQRSEQISGEPGTVGAVSDIYFVVQEEEMVIRETIKSIAPKESMSMQFTSDFSDMDYKLELVPTGGETKIKSTTTARGNSLFSRSLVAIMKGGFVAQETTNLEALKKVIQKNTDVYQ